MNYRLTPQLLDMGLVSVPLDIEGPWAAPSIKPDMVALAEGLAQQQLGGELETLEDKLKEEVGGLLKGLFN